MFPILYKKDETDFVHNGLGVMSGAITAVPDEELNGPFEITIEYDSEGFLADKIANGMIVKAKANDRQDPQLFRIYAIEKSLASDNLIIHGQHITYDLAGNFVEQLVLNKATLKEAMEAIKKNLAYPTRFNITSTNNETVSSTSLYRTNPLQMIAGTEGSILQIWGGQIERDNFNLIMHKRRGSDDGVLVTYKKNLTGLEAKFDESNVVTRIFPFKYIEASEDEPEQLITIDGKYIDSPNINKYPVIKILPVDFSDDESIKNKTDLYNASKDFFKTGSKDLPTVEMEVEFEPLHGTEEYKDIAVLELVGMGDTITVRHSKMGVDVKGQVVQVEYDAIAEKNKKVSIGNVKARLTDTINSNADIINNVGDRITSANQKANEAIQAANGKNKIYWGPDEPTGNLNEGDVWFKTVDGEYTRTYRYDGVQWQLVVSMDVKEVMDEAQEARNRADEAVANANLATNNALEAIEQAQGAFDEAVNAHDIADAAREASETAGRIAGEAKEQVGTAIADARQAMEDARNALNNVDELETGLEIVFGEINNQLLSKVSKTEFDGLKGTVTTHSTQIQQTQNDIKAKADKSYVDTVKGTVDSHSTLIQQNAEEIQSKASQSNVDTLTGKVESHESRITQNAQKIESKMSTVDANAKFATQSQLTQTSGSLTSQISAVQDNLDNLEIGGRNLAPFTGLDFVRYDLTVVNDDGVIVNDHTFKIKANPPNGTAALFGFASVSIGEQYIINADISDAISTVVGVTVYDENKNLLEEQGLLSGDISWVGTYKGYQMHSDNIVPLPLKFKVEDNRVKYVRLRLGIYRGQLVTRDVFIKYPKLEKGNKATDWTPAPEDMVSTVQFSKLEQTVDSISGQVTKKVDKTVYDSFVQQTAQSLASKISTVDADKKYATQSSLTQTAQGLQSTVNSVRNDLENLEIGGRNLVSNSDKLNDGWGSGYSGATATYEKVSMTEEWGFSEAYRVRINGGTSDIKGVRTTTGRISEPLVLEENYTYSLYVKNLGKYVFRLHLNGLSPTGGSQSVDIQPNESRRISMSGKRRVNYDWFQSIFRTLNVAHNIDVIVGREKVEKGNKATDWSPAPEDTDARFESTTSQITQLAGVVDTKISTTDANAKFATQSQLTQTASSLQSTITSVRNDLAGLEIGDRNLLLKSGDPVTSSAYNIKDYYLAEPIVEGETYTIVMKATLGSGKSYFAAYNSGGSVQLVRMNPEDKDTNGVYKVTFSGRVGAASNQFVRIYHMPSSVTVSSKIEWIKLVKGNQASSDWSPAPEDMATQSQISQLSDAINLRVKQNDVINQINLDTSGVLIQGKKLTLDGNVTVTGTFKVTNANIVDVNAGKITSGTLDAGKASIININASNITTGKLNANSVTISATNGNAKLDLSANGLHSYDSNGKLRIALNIRSAGGVGSDPATLRFFSGNGSVSAGVGMNVNDTFVIGSTANSVHNEIYSGGNTILYANQIRMVTKEGTGGYGKRYFIINSLRSAQGDYNPCLYPDTSGWGYVGTSANRLWRIYTNYLHCVDLVNLSTRDSKANIQEANIKQMQSAFDDMDLVTFNYKNEDGSPRDELKVGWIAEESPSLITSKDKKQISLNNTVGVMAGSMKYQQQRIDQLEKANEQLVLKVARLEERIHKLEAA